MAALYGIARYTYGANSDDYAFSVVSDGEKVEIFMDPADDAPESFLESQEEIIRAMEIRLSKVVDRSPMTDLEAISYNMPFSILDSDEYKTFEDAMDYAKNSADLRSELMFDGQEPRLISLSPGKTEDEEEGSE